MNEDTPRGFLSRWSSRKAESRQAKPLAPATDHANETPSERSTADPSVTAVAAQPSAQAVNAPTLDDVNGLTPDADFSTYVRQEVPTEVKNAAMKKLFADPHFNVMDGLDVYIDDYSQPDPLPPAILRQMASAHALNLVEQPAEHAPVQRAADATTDNSTESVAQCATSGPSPETLDHDHADLRLQPDPSPGSQDTGSTPA